MNKSAVGKSLLRADKMWLIERHEELLEALKAINNLANAEGEQVGFSLKAQRLAQEAIAKSEGRV